MRLWHSKCHDKRATHDPSDLVVPFSSLCLCSQASMKAADISMWCFYHLESLNYDYCKHACCSAKHRWSPVIQLREALLYLSSLFAFNTSTIHESQEMSLTSATRAFLISSPVILESISCGFKGLSASPPRYLSSPGVGSRCFPASPHFCTSVVHPPLSGSVFQIKLAG